MLDVGGAMVRVASCQVGGKRKPSLALVGSTTTTLPRTMTTLNGIFFAPCPPLAGSSG